MDFKIFLTVKKKEELHEKKHEKTVKLMDIQWFGCMYKTYVSKMY